MVYFYFRYRYSFFLIPKKKGAVLQRKVVDTGTLYYETVPVTHLFIYSSTNYLPIKFQKQNKTSKTTNFTQSML